MPKLPTEFTEFVFHTANELGERKEAAYIAALDAHFGANDWAPADAAEVCAINIYADGSEELLIDGELAVFVHPIFTKTEITDEGTDRPARIKCLFSQEIENKYNKINGQ